MEPFCIVLLVFVIMNTVFEMYSLYIGDWEFPFWYISNFPGQHSISSVFLMSLLAYGIGLTFDWVSAILSLLAYVFVYIALYFYITMKAPRKVRPEKISAFESIFWIIFMIVMIFGTALKYSQDTVWRMIIFSLLNMFFLFLPLYYLFEVREQKLEEKRQQDEERRRQEEEKRYQEEEERRKKKEKEEEWIIVTDEINGKTEEEQ